MSRPTATCYTFSMFLSGVFPHAARASCLCAFIVLWSGFGILLKQTKKTTHTHTHTHTPKPLRTLHIAISVQVPQEVRTFLTFLEWEGEGGGSRGEEGLTSVNRSLFYLQPISPSSLLDYLHPVSLKQSFSP